MSKRDFFLLFLFGFLASAFYWFRNGFIGADSYYYLNFVCNQDVFRNSFFENLIFGLLPCDFFILKTILILVFVTSLFVLYFCFEHFFPKKALIATIFCYSLSPMFFYAFFKFENDVFGLFLMLLAMLLYIKTINQDNKLKYVLYSVVSLSIIYISTKIYALTGYFIFIGALTNPFFTIATFYSIITEPRVISSLTPNFLIMENLPILGFATLFILVIGLFKPFLKKETIITILFSLAQARYAIFAPYFLTLGIINLLKNLPKQKAEFLEKQLLLFSIMGMLAFNIIGLTYYPNDSLLTGIEETVEFAEDNNLTILNDWETGYFFRHFGYDTKYYSSWPNPDYNSHINFLGFTKTTLDCETVRKIEEYTLYYCKNKQFLHRDLNIR